MSRINNLEPRLNDKKIEKVNTYGIFHYISLFNEIAAVDDYIDALGRIISERSLMVTHGVK